MISLAVSMLLFKESSNSNMLYIWQKMKKSLVQLAFKASTHFSADSGYPKFGFWVPVQQLLVIGKNKLRSKILT